MSDLADRLRKLIEGVPPGGAVTLPREAVARWLEGGAGGAEAPADGHEAPVADLTVADLAEAHDKAESTVRGWLQSVPGTYRLGQELRISREAWRAYLDSLAEDGDDGPATVRSRPSADLGSWRNGGDS